MSADRIPAGPDGAATRAARRDLVSDPLFSPAHAAIDLRVAVPDVLPTVLDVLDSIDLRAHAEALDGRRTSRDPGAARTHRAPPQRARPPPTPQEILITAGAQSGIALCAALLINPGDVALREKTSWPGFIDAVAREAAAPRASTPTTTASIPMHSNERSSATDPHWSH